jgi:hypothetical protein
VDFGGGNRERDSATSSSPTTRPAPIGGASASVLAGRWATPWTWTARQRAGDGAFGHGNFGRQSGELGTKRISSPSITRPARTSGARLGPVKKSAMTSR